MTGVQTCALPISSGRREGRFLPQYPLFARRSPRWFHRQGMPALSDKKTFTSDRQRNSDIGDGTSGEAGFAQPGHFVPMSRETIIRDYSWSQRRRARIARVWGRSIATPAHMGSSGQAISDLRHLRRAVYYIAIATRGVQLLIQRARWRHENVPMREE